MWPRCRSGAVGSSPSFTRSGRPSARRCSSAPSGETSTALRDRNDAGDSIRPNARVRRPARPGPPAHLGPTRGRVSAQVAAGTCHERDERTSTIPAESADDTTTPVVEFPRSRTRARRAQAVAPPPQAQALPDPQAARADGAVRPQPAGRGLGRVRHVHGARVGPAADRPSAAHRPSMLYDTRDSEIGTLTGNERRIYLSETEIAPVMKHAIIAIEDRRFYTNNGVDLRGIARAAVQDISEQRAVQGASTIPQQFVKIYLAAENERTVFQKLREAALAYHLIAQVVEGADPPQLPELDLLRQRRLRDRVGRAHLLLLQPRRLRRARQPIRARRCCCRTRRRCWPGSSPRRARTTRSSIPSPPSAGATSCCCGCSSRAT